MEEGLHGFLIPKGRGATNQAFECAVTSRPFMTLSREPSSPTCFVQASAWNPVQSAQAATDAANWFEKIWIWAQ